MQEFLSSFFGKFFNSQVVVQKHELHNSTNFLNFGRQFYLVRIGNGDLTFLVVKTSQNEEYTIKQYSRQYIILQESEALVPVFYFEKSTFSQEQAFINNNIPFFTSKGNVYIPFAGLSLKGNYFSAARVSAEKMMPATQKIFLELIYSKTPEIKCSVLDKKLQLSKMSVTRACEQLKAMDLIEMEIRGRTGYIRPKNQGLELYQKAKDKLINPVQETLFIPQSELPKNALLSGESLLGQLTMLNPPEVKQYAVYKGSVEKKSLHPQEIRWSQTQGLVQLELWKYEPELFIQNGVIDPVSLACSLSNIYDERVEGELEDLLGGFEW